MLKGPYARGDRVDIAVFLILGTILALLGASHALDRLAPFFLPLGYVSWLGYLLIVLAFIGWSSHRSASGALQYVREGIAIPVRVRRLTVEKKNHGHAGVKYKLCVEVDAIHPDLHTAGVFPVCAPESYDTAEEAADVRIEPGDVITAVYLSEQFPRSLAIYGLLELTRESTLYHTRGKARLSAMNALAMPMLPVGLLGIYVLGFCWPKDPPVGIFYVCLAAGISCAFPAALLVRRSLRTRGRRLHPWFAAWRPRWIHWMQVVVPLGWGYVGAQASLDSLLAANAVLDRSEPQYHIVRIVRFRCTREHLGLGHRFHLEYEEPDRSSRGEVRTNPEEMNRLAGEWRVNPESELVGAEAAETYRVTKRWGAIETRRGRLGWEWVRQVSPVVGPSMDGTTAFIELHDGSVRVVPAPAGMR